jgi:pimeloyl-ACP methyl ester carboxylesterase
LAVDVMRPARHSLRSFNSWILQQNIPNAQLIIYPDANHGSQFQYPKRFVRHVSDFLSE